MNNKSRELQDWEEVREEKNRELVVVDVSEVDDKAPFIKAMSQWSEKFRRQYDKLKVENVIDYETQRELVVLTGIRKETDEEFRERMGISDDTSWSVQYAKLTGCTPLEAKNEMMKMFKNGTPLTPEEWINDKKSKIEEFLNIGKASENKETD